MTKKYYFEVIEKVSKFFEVEADSEEEAQDILYDRDLEPTRVWDWTGDEVHLLYEKEID